MKRLKPLQSALLIVIVAPTAILPADAVLAGNASPQVYGQNIGNWGYEWWEWALSFPTATTPILQSGAVDCSAGQSGKVWFLAGNFGGKTERTCSIKRGKAVFFPIFNALFWTPLDPNVPEDCTDALDCRTRVAANIDTLKSWICTIDDKPCVWTNQIVREQSDAQPFNILKGTFIATDAGYKPGVRQTSVADGYWVMLDPLPPGKHTIHFTADAPTFGNNPLDVTYKLTVE